MRGTLERADSHGGGREQVNIAPSIVHHNQDFFQAAGEEIYLDMSRLNKSSDYLEMERLQLYNSAN